MELLKEILRIDYNDILYETENIKSIQLRCAIRHVKTGKVYVANYFKNFHFAIVDEYNLRPKFKDEYEMGFVTEDDQFLTRDQAAAYVNQEYPLERPGSLDSIDVRRARKKAGYKEFPISRDLYMHD